MQSSKAIHVGLVAVAVVLMAMLAFSDVFMVPAYAWTVEGYATGADARGIAFLDGYIYISTAGANTIRLFHESDPSTLVQSLSGCTGCTGLLVYDDKVYAAGSTTLYEITRVGSTISITRSIGTGNICANMNQANLKESTGELVCNDATADRYRIVDLDSMSITFTSAVFTATCDSPSYANAADGSYIMFSCAVDDDLETYVFGTDTHKHTASLDAELTEFVLDVQYGTVLASDDSDLELWTYNFGTGFTSVQTGYTLGTFADMYLQADADRFLITTSGDNLYAFNSGNTTAIDRLWTIATMPEGALDSNGSIYSESAIEVYIAAGSSEDKHYILDLTDLPLGSGGAEPVGNTCELGQIAVDFSLNQDGSNIQCYDVEDGIGQGGGTNPLFSDSNSGLGGLPVTLSVLMNISVDQAKLLSTIGLILMSLILLIIPAWRFGVNPPFFVYFLIVLLDVALAVTLGWVEALYFAIMVVIVALGAGLKWSGVI